MKRLPLLLALGFAVLAAACSGGGGNSTPPPPTGGFTPASLKGNYAFSMAGEDPFTGAFITRVGSFIADGNGNITSAIEDFGNGGQPTTVAFSQGTYTMQANGKGTITLPSAVGGALLLNFSMSTAAPSGVGLLIQADGNGTSSGSFNQQTISSFTQPFAAASYVFDFSGVDTGGFTLSIVGEVATNGAGSVGTGTEDVNDGGAATPSGPLPIIAGGSVTPDNTAGNNANFGRSTITFNGNTFAFYPIDQTHAKFIETDGAALTSGDFFQQTGTIPTQNNFTSSFVFLTGGSNVNVGGAVTRAARFTADGAGNLGTLLFDQNAQKSDGTGSHSCVDPSDSGCGLSVTTATYSITGAASPGRGTLSIMFSGQSAAVDGVFYIASPTLGVIQDVSTNIVADGSMLGQAGNIATSGNFAVNISGQVAPSGGNVGFEEDIVGQYALSGNTVTGASDLIELGTTSNHNVTPTNVATSGTSLINGDGTKRNSLQLVFTPQSGPAAKRNFTAYVGGSPPQLLLIGTDTADIDTGIVLTQTTPQ